MTRRELMERLGVDELREQLAFERIYPFEDGYWQAALIALTVARANGAKRAKLEDFLPTKGKPKARRQSGPQMLALVRRVAHSQDKKRAV